MIADINDWLKASDYTAFDYAALSLLLLVAFMAVRMRDLLASAVMLSIFSLLMALTYLMFDAPDVALTEAVVGAGISTILFISALSFTGRIQKRTHMARRICAAVVTGLVSGILIASTAALPPYASPEAPIHRHVAPYYLEHAQEDMAVPNYVTAILASYRAFDTLGEIAVIFIAGIGITALLMNVPQVRKITLPDISEKPAPKRRKKGKTA
jgi:multicomponent Na+:H+ antiporter subunit B